MVAQQLTQQEMKTSCGMDPLCFTGGDSGSQSLGKFLGSGSGSGSGSGESVEGERCRRLVDSPFSFLFFSFLFFFFFSFSRIKNKEEKKNLKTSKSQNLKILNPLSSVCIYVI